MRQSHGGLGIGDRGIGDLGFGTGGLGIWGLGTRGRGVGDTAAVVGGLVSLDEGFHPDRILLPVPVADDWVLAAGGFDQDI